MGIRNIRGKRSIAYSIVILLILAIFALGFFFYFVPLNKKTIHKNGFLILNTVANNIAEKAKGHERFFYNLYRTDIQELDSQKFREGDTISVINKLIDYNNENVSEENRINVNVSFFDREAIETGGLINEDDIETETYVDDHNNNLTFLIRKETSEKGLLFSESAEQFLRPLLATQKKELFGNYLIAKTTDSRRVQVFYADEGLGVRTDKALDSLFRKNPAVLFSGVSDIRTHDLDYKVFYHPFKIGNEEFVLCGFVELDLYNADMRHVPFYFVFPLAILFLFILFSFPIIRFNLMDSNETMRIRDVILLGLSVFMSVCILALIIIHSLLWKGAEERAKRSLVELSNAIKDSLTGELNAAHNQLLFLDSLRKEIVPLNGSERGAGAQRVDITKELLRQLMVKKHNFYLFDRISWLDSAGNQKIKADLSSITTFTNVRDRAYFKAFRNGTAYLLPGSQSEHIGLEPLYSWTNADFNITISKPSDNYIVAMASKMHSVLGTIVPLGYGFCIINEQGDVLLHSEENRNLRENFFDRTEPSSSLVSAVATRQARKINDAIVYGKQHMLYVQPLRGLPFHVVSFFDKSNIVSMNMRILTFALIFSFLTFMTCLILWFSLVNRAHAHHPLALCSLDCLVWLLPQKRETLYYVHASFYLLAYVLAALAAILFSTSYSNNSFNIPSLMIMTPLNVVFALHIMRKSLLGKSKENKNKKPEANKDKKSLVFLTEAWKERKTAVVCLLVHVAISAFVLKLIAGYSTNNGFIIFQAIILCLLALYTFVLKGPRKLVFGALKLPGVKSRYFSSWYAFLLTCLILCLSVLPSTHYTWYAHGQEIIQSLKSQQLHYANAVKNRSTKLLALTTNRLRNGDTIPPEYQRSWLLSKGIYTINNDKVSFARHDDQDTTGQGIWDELYATFADESRDNQSGSHPFTLLRDESDDGTWRWLLSQSNELRFRSQLPVTGYFTFTDLPTDSNFYLSSVLHHRFAYMTLNDWFVLVLVTVLVALLAVGLYYWIRRNTGLIFLSNFIHHPLVPDAVDGKNLAEEYYGANATISENLYSHDGYSHHPDPYDEVSLLAYEKELADVVENGNRFYAGIWKGSSEKEKFILYDFAKDGLVNYKNSYEIIELLRNHVFVVRDERLRLFSPGFRAYILTKPSKSEIAELQHQHKENSSWQAIRLPLLIFLVGTACLIFFTQEGAFDKLLVLAGGISTLLSLIMKLFGGDEKGSAKSK